jgi:hypothetical protein
MLGRNRPYFVKKKNKKKQKNTHSDSTKKFSETDIINMLEFLIDNIFVIFGGRVFQQTCLWVLTVLLFLPTCSFISMRQTSYRGLLKKAKRG